MSTSFELVSGGKMSSILLEVTSASLSKCLSGARILWISASVVGKEVKSLLRASLATLEGFALTFSTASDLLGASSLTSSGNETLN